MPRYYVCDGCRDDSTAVPTRLHGDNGNSIILRRHYCAKCWPLIVDAIDAAQNSFRADGRSKPRKQGCS